MTALDVVDDQRRAGLTVIPLGSKASDVASHVNRRRDQIGLEPTSENEILAGEKGKGGRGRGESVRYRGPGAPDVARRILVAMIPRGDRAWLFRIMDPADLVGREEDGYRAFLESVRFRRASPEGDR